MVTWRIIYYETSTATPIYDFIENLDETAKAKLVFTFSLLEEFGVHLGMPHVKKIKGTDLWELRILGGDNVRILYVAVTGRTFLLLHGFVKKKMETDKKEIKIAQKRLISYLTPNK